MTAVIRSVVAAAAVRRTTSRRPIYVRQTAQRTLSTGQRVFVAAAALVLVAGLSLQTLLTFRLLAIGMIAFSAAYVTLRCVLVITSDQHRFPPRTEVPTDLLPAYTTLHPMYDEANMIPVVVAAMEALDYPKDRMQCLLVLEERDRATVEAARSYALPDYFQIVETPTARPYGKPKACDYALQFATGEFVVIFDAEDRPDPQQLRLAVETFRSAEERGEPLGCLQARLFFDNQAPVKGALGEVVKDQAGYDVRPSTWCTRFLGNEYSVHFELVLAGLSHLGLPVPLGGTSNHFPVAVLRDVAFRPEVMPELPDDEQLVGAWDPWNVAEDAELGGAIAAHGYTTALIDSQTDEEAVLTPLAAINQRSRWVKGYAQTSLVLLRRPVRNMLAMGPISYLVFLLQVGGTYLSLLLAPIGWAVTGAFIATRSQRIIELFPGPLLYLGVLLVLGGNLTLVTVSLVAALRRKHFGAVRFLLVVTPLWWILLSAATWVATVELLFPRWRPSWNKTAHGIRYATRRRAGWLAVQRWAREWDTKPGRQPRRPSPRVAPPRPALAPRTAPAAARTPHRYQPPPRPAAEAAAAADRATRALIAERRAAAQSARRDAARAARELQLASPGDFGAGVPR